MAKDTVKKETKTKKTAKKSEAKSKAAKAVDVKIPIRLRDTYRKEIVPKLMKEFQYKNVHEVPRLMKIVVNVGVGEASQDQKLLEEAVRQLELITGQRPTIRKAKKSISNFKLREGMKIGAKVTLRREKMYEFFDRLMSIALPRVRDFRGYSDKSFDGRGNYTMGIKEHIIFPEVDVDKINRVMGMDITFVTSAKTDAEGYGLLAAFGFPFRKKEVQN